MESVEAKAVTVTVSGYIHSALSEEVKQKLADHGVEIIRVDDEEPEVDRAREIVFMDFSTKNERGYAELIAALNRQNFSDMWHVPIQFEEFHEPVAYKLPRYKQPARATMRPRQSVLRGK